MRLVLQTRKRCPGCGAQMIRADEKLQCPNGGCALSPLATLQFARACAPAPNAPVGYVPADHRVPPANMAPGSRRAVRSEPAREPKPTRRLDRSLSAFDQSLAVRAEILKIEAEIDRDARREGRRA